MTHDRPEISRWLEDRGYDAVEITKILVQLDKFDDHVHRESLFEHLASGVFDIGPIIQAALEETDRGPPRG